MLEARNLTKLYGGFVAVNNLSFSLQPGDVFGFIGSNGAGKTTTIKMIATLLEPTSGTAIVNGHDVQRDPMAVRRELGYMPDFYGVYDDIKVWEYLDFFANLYDVPINQRPRVIDEVLELTDLGFKKNVFVQSLSRGMQQRLCLARCLVHDPSVLLLDEPASGLDPRARAELRELILELSRMGKIVLVSSHILPELSGFCNTVGIIEQGNLLSFGAVADVVRSVRPVRQIIVRVHGELGALIELAKRASGVQSCQPAEEQDRVIISLEGDDAQQEQLLRGLIDQGMKVLEFYEDHANLEDVFLKLTTGAVN